MTIPVDPCLAIIPARGGSKGLPGKNIRPLVGVPLLGHSLRCAGLVPRLGAVVVSTDDDQIAHVAEACGGRVPFRRPAELARDDSAMMPVLSHALLAMEKIEGRRFETVLLLDPTSPGRTPADIERAFELLADDDTADGVVACSRPRFNPFWVGVVDDGGAIAPAFPGGLEHKERRQDLPSFYRINGALYLWRRDFVAREPARWRDGRHLLLEMPEERAFSIDDASEFELADLLLREKVVRLPWIDG